MSLEAYGLITISGANLSVIKRKFLDDRFRKVGLAVGEVEILSAIGDVGLLKRFLTEGF